MSARSIGELVAPIIYRSLTIAQVQCLLELMETPSARKNLIMSWYQAGELDAVQAELLIEHNNLEAA